MKTGRRPPIYPKTPGHLPCSSLTHPLPLPSRRPSVSFGGFGLREDNRRYGAATLRGPQPHLGILHPQSGAPGSHRPKQSGCDSRQSPWLIYRNTASILRDELERQSRDLYNIWAGGKYAAVQDIAGLFYARCTDLYLKDGGHIGMVMPHSALQTGQYTKWRTGSWRAARGGRVLTVDFSQKTAWDLERLEPNNFFPVPASVVFAQRTGLGANARRLAGEVECWLGTPGSSDVRRVRVPMTDVSANIISPYDGYSRKGADIYPRCFFFVEETINPSVVQAGQTVTVNPRRGSQDKKPWRNLDITAISEQTIEGQHVLDVHLGETLARIHRRTPMDGVRTAEEG